MGDSKILPLASPGIDRYASEHQTVVFQGPGTLHLNKSSRPDGLAENL